MEPGEGQFSLRSSVNRRCREQSCCLVAKLCLALLWLHGLQSAMFLCPWDFPGKNTGVGCHFILQKIFPTLRSNPHHLHWQVDSLAITKAQRTGCVHAQSCPSLRPHGLQSARLLCPGDFPGKNTGVVSFSRGLCKSGIIHLLCLQADFLLRSHWGSPEQGRKHLFL